MSTTIQPPSSTVTSDLLAAVNPKDSSKVDAGSVQGITDQFMTLLVTQLKNQDPMNPADNAQITSQLAQLSTVTGVNKLNTTLTSLQSNYKQTESLAATGMIGHGVLSAGNAITLSGSKAIFGVQLASAADDVQVSVLDAGGHTVQTIDLGAQNAGSLPLSWDGATTTASGSTGPLAPDGHYTFAVKATRGGTPLKDAGGLTFGTVSSVSTSATDGVKLNVSGVGSLTLADVAEVL